MRARTAVMFAFACALAAAADFVTIDRIAVVAVGHAIKTSDIDRDVRTTEFINDQPLDLGAEAKRQSAQRLIDQQIIRNELRVGGYKRPEESETAALVGQLRKDRFGGSDVRLRRTLARYGISEDELRARLLWQAAVLSFIDQRFRPGVLITDQDIHNYYEQHRAELERQHPGATFEALAPKIRATVAEEEINQQFFAWLDQRRKDMRVQFIQGALE